MSRYLLLFAFGAATFIGAAAPVHQSTNTPAAVWQGELVLTATRTSKTKKFRSSRASRCDKLSKPASCYFCQLTYDGYCACNYDFPCI